MPSSRQLARNPQLTEYTVQDLNLVPTLPYEDSSFDFCLNVVSVDYLTRPLEVFDEMHRVLRPGGTAIMSFSNRCFPTKAITMWGQTDDAGHLWIVGSYFRFSGRGRGGWFNRKAVDISGHGDPMWVVQGSTPG